MPVAALRHPVRLFERVRPNLGRALLHHALQHKSPDLSCCNGRALRLCRAYEEGGHLGPFLHIVDWSASSIDPPVTYGAAQGEPAIPLAMRRRMPDFMRQAITCALAIMTHETELVFASRYGDMTTTVSLLEAISEQDLLSPTAFSSAVHNASAGVADQILNLRLSHTAVAAGPDSFGAGLVEAWLRLATGEAAAIALVYGDQSLPEPFAACGDNGASRFVGLRLERGAAGPAFDWGGCHDLGRLITALADGTRQLRVPVPV